MDLEIGEPPDTPSLINQLPVDILYSIFLFIPYGEAFALDKVCLLWQSLLDRSDPSWLKMRRSAIFPTAEELRRSRIEANYELEDIDIDVQDDDPLLRDNDGEEHDIDPTVEDLQRSRIVANYKLQHVQDHDSLLRDDEEDDLDVIVCEDIVAA